MNTKIDSGFSKNWREIIASFFKLGILSYGGPAIMGLMQAELQEKRQWVTRERFIEGLSLVNMLPGAGATQLGIFLGYARGGWWGGLLAGLCFVLPAFFIMLCLVIGYTAFGATPLLRGALYGLGPVVLGIFVVAVYRLGKSAMVTRSQVIIAFTAAAAAVYSPLGIATILLFAGEICLVLFYSNKRGGNRTVCVARWFHNTAVRNGITTGGNFRCSSRRVTFSGYRGHCRVFFQSWRTHLWWRLKHDRVYSRTSSQSVPLAYTPGIYGWPCPGSAHPRTDFNGGGLCGL